ncbi:ABC transporter ATP-binding protein [Alcaligenaceae bacterium A4P071]|nr:ABC transporter ATP-binding protein [Alcaligenaceae bacterium A4P071]
MTAPVPLTTPILHYRGASLVLERGDRHTTLVRDIDLDVLPNEIVALVGESGSGKSLTALSALGLLPNGIRLNATEARIAGQDIRALSNPQWRALRGSHVGMVFQEPMSALNPVLTIGDQVGEVLKYKLGIVRRARRAHAIDLLDQVEIARAASIHDAYPHQLSGGMRQRVGLAIALAGRPSLLIADEPTTALDNVVQVQILKLIVRLAEQSRIGVLFITHDLSVVAHVADRVAVMQAGRMVERDTVQRVFQSPRHPYTRHLIDLAPRIPRPGQEPDLPGLTDPLLVAEGLTQRYAATGRTTNEPVLALDNVSIAIERGRTLGVVGESGSGKSTLARAIVGLIQPDAGRIVFDGENLSRLNDRARFRFGRHIQMVFQDPVASLNPRMRVGDIVVEPVIAHDLLDGRAAASVAREMLDAVQLPAAFAAHYPHELSGGQRQRVGIARALAVRPKLVVCDEPVSALDVSVQAQILKLLKSLQPEFNVTYLFIAHGMDSVYAMSDTIAVMQRGRVVEHGNRDQIFGRPAHPYTQQLMGAMLGCDPAAGRVREWVKAA